METVLFHEVSKNIVLFFTEYRVIEQGWYDLLLNYPKLWDFTIRRDNQKNVRLEQNNIIVIETNDGKEYRMDLKKCPSMGDDL
ncbi:MAG: hypothetical protein IKQ61_04495 [Spirochaetales bacterium]|nr:hypothetical protein [Spirochaetales bacterium]